jgi:hypothetical protein
MLWWFSGKINGCHPFAPGSIPGQSKNISFLYSCYHGTNHNVLNFNQTVFVVVAVIEHLPCLK